MSTRRVEMYYTLYKAIAQSTKYIYELEREANSIKFLEKVGKIKTIKPRCVLIFGRSNDWDESKKESYRILNASYHNLTIMTYYHVLARAKRILELDEKEKTIVEDGLDNDLIDSELGAAGGIK